MRMKSQDLSNSNKFVATLKLLPCSYPHGKNEFDRVNGLEKARDILDTLQRAHKGTKPVKKAMRQLIEG
jgi:hypothetical protein